MTHQKVKKPASGFPKAGFSSFQAGFQMVGLPAAAAVPTAAAKAAAPSTRAITAAVERTLGPRTRLVNRNGATIKAGTVHSSNCRIGLVVINLHKTEAPGTSRLTGRNRSRSGSPLRKSTLKPVFRGFKRQVAYKQSLRHPSPFRYFSLRLLCRIGRTRWLKRKPTPKPLPNSPSQTHFKGFGRSASNSLAVGRYEETATADFWS